jgi:hypothetical protein
VVNAGCPGMRMGILPRQSLNKGLDARAGIRYKFGVIAYSAVVTNPTESFGFRSGSCPSGSQSVSCFTLRQVRKQLHLPHPYHQFPSTKRGEARGGARGGAQTISPLGRLADERGARAHVASISGEEDREERESWRSNCNVESDTGASQWDEEKRAALHLTQLFQNCLSRTPERELRRSDLFGRIPGGMEAPFGPIQSRREIQEFPIDEIEYLWRDVCPNYVAGLVSEGDRFPGLRTAETRMPRHRCAELFPHRPQSESIGDPGEDLPGCGVLVEGREVPGLQWGGSQISNQ